MSIQKRHTRFRAYQLGEKGSSFSYYDGTHFTLIEARVTDLSRPRLTRELEICSRDRLDCLHITSWDEDHCDFFDLEEILDVWKPQRIEYPGYDPAPDKEGAKKCRQRILDYAKQKTPSGSRPAPPLVPPMRGAAAVAAAPAPDPVVVQKIDPPYIKSLNTGESLGYRDLLYHPRELVENNNDNSTIKLFRAGSFNVASLGDVESKHIGDWLRRCSIFNSEVDVMILAHHGADNGFTSQRFLKEVRPQLAVCSSNYDNQYEHPKEEIRELLYRLGIPLYTTKTGDFIVRSVEPHTTKFQVVNLIKDSEEVSSVKNFDSKKSKVLRHNADTVRNHYNRGHW